MTPPKLPRFFRVAPRFPRPELRDLPAVTAQELAKFCPDDLSGKSVAIAVGSRGIANLAVVVKASVAFLKSRGASPFIVPAMGSHGGATAEGQEKVLHEFSITESNVGAPIRSSMEVIEVCRAPQGFPIFFDRLASEADGVLVINRVKPHTRFDGAIQSGLMKMLLIGLGKHAGAEVYHRVLVHESFDDLAAAVSTTVIERCNILGGLALLENAYEETAQIVGLEARRIVKEEPALLKQVQAWMPKLPFDRAELLIIDRIGKNISGTGMDTNIIGRKSQDHLVNTSERPAIHHIYVRSLTRETGGNASGIGMAELCHQRVLDSIDKKITATNCITANHLTGAMIPIAFPNDLQAIETTVRLAGFVEPEEVAAMWIRDTLSLETIECSEVFYASALERDDIEILSEPTSLEFNAAQDLVDRF